MIRELKLRNFHDHIWSVSSKLHMHMSEVQPAETPFENKMHLSIYNQEFHYLLRFSSSKYLISFRYPFSAEMNQVSATSFYKGESYWVSTITPVISGVLLQLPQITIPKFACSIFCSMYSVLLKKWIEIESQ